MVRDLDKLRTKSEFRLRTGHLALIVLATAVAVGLLFVVGNAMAGTDDDLGEPPAAADPFAGLQQAAPEKPAPAPARKPPALAAAAVPDPEALPPLALTFHERLSRPSDAPPMPLVAVPTVPADPPAPPGPEDAPLPIDSPAAHQPPPPLPGAPVSAPPRSPAVELAPAAAAADVVPAAPPPGVPVAPPPVQSVREPLAPALPPGDPQPRFDEEPNPALAQAGEHGVFTLQVASFALQDEAIAYMNMLRQRGHESFIVRADCGERGLLYRVRVGPFDSQPAAERYRRKFERIERIPTFVVRRTRPEPTPLPGIL
ncbi:MAG: SPOR domain-containing protein [Deltaproteobacteria bacterium]|nr:SPOR domain-containing protein [Deltaproteobacteria bacterium]